MKTFLLPHVWCAVFALSALAVAPSRAADAPPAAAPKGSLPAVEVSSVSFDSPTGAGNHLPWQEIIIELKVNPSKEGNFVSHVRVALTLGTEITSGPKLAEAAAGNTKPVEFYRASVEVVALEAGTSPDIRFYLPPEIVKRDSLHGEQKFYAVEISAGGTALPPSHAAVSTAVPILQTFLDRATSAASANNGILLPQMLTPFAFDGARPSPTFIRPEAVGQK